MNPANSYDHSHDFIFGQDCFNPAAIADIIKSLNQVNKGILAANKRREYLAKLLAIQMRAFDPLPDTVTTAQWALIYELIEDFGETYPHLLQKTPHPEGLIMLNPQLFR